MSSTNWIEAKLKESGCKLTEQRRLIIRFFEEEPGHYTAQEVYERVKDICEKINFSTIYRNLELLCNMGIIKKLDIESGISHYELNKPGHHHHVVCKGCGDMKEIDVCPYESIQNKELKALGFEATEHKFEIYGYCSKCTKK